MDAVREVYEPGCVINSLPLDRAITCVAVAHRFEHAAAHPHLRVTVHTGLRGRHAGKRCELDRRMAIAAIDPQNSRMMFMAERNRLDRRHTRAGPIRGT